MPCKEDKWWFKSQTVEKSGKPERWKPKEYSAPAFTHEQGTCCRCPAVRDWKACCVENQRILKHGTCRRYHAGTKPISNEIKFSLYIKANFEWIRDCKQNKEQSQ